MWFHRTLGERMGKVVAQIKVLPSSTEVNLEELKKKIEEEIKPEKIEEEPIAFGLVAVRIFKIIEDNAKFLDEIEEKLKSFEEVSQVEVEQLSRI